MHIFSNNEYKGINYILQMKEKDLMNTMFKILKKFDYNPIKKGKYIIAEGKIPVALAAHLDTVFDKPPSNIYYDREQNVMWGMGGAGFDDRAGVYMIFKVLKAGYRPNIIFTTDEEIGGIGAEALVKDYPNSPFKDLKYIIQLDRQGIDDCVFYQCDNQEFTDYIETFGFVEAIGSFTDISVICPAWGMAGVNLSIGYVNEHTQSEILYVNGFHSTYKRLIKIIEDINKVKKFDYIPSKWSYYNYYNNNGKFKFDSYPDEVVDEFYYPTEDDYYPNHISYLCSKCHHSYDGSFIFKVKERKGVNKFVCYNCIDDNFDWCERCGEAFVKFSDNQKICEECAESVNEPGRAS